MPYLGHQALRQSDMSRGLRPSPGRRVTKSPSRNRNTSPRRSTLFQCKIFRKYPRANCVTFGDLIIVDFQIRHLETKIQRNNQMQNCTLVSEMNAWLVKSKHKQLFVIDIESLRWKLTLGCQLNSPNQTFNIINISSNHQTKLLNRRFQRRHEIHWDLKACDGQRHVLARCLNRRSLANFMLRASCGAILPWSRIQKQLCRFIYVYKSEYSILTTLIGTKRVELPLERYTGFVASIGTGGVVPKGNRLLYCLLVVRVPVAYS